MATVTTKVYDLKFAGIVKWLRYVVAIHVMRVRFSLPAPSCYDE